jgi:hypothetical protein
MADTIRQPKFVTFPEADHADERVAAVLISKDAETGDLKAYVKDVPGREQPDPEIVAALVQSVELRNL